MLLNKNRVITITSKAILSDRLLMKHTNLDHDCRIDIFSKESGGFTLLITEDSEKVPFEQDLANCMFMNTRDYEENYLVDFLKLPVVRKSQKLLKAIYRESPYLFLLNSRYSLDLEDEVGIVCSDSLKGEYVLANGIDVLSSCGRQCNMYGLSGKKVGCYLNQKELIFSGIGHRSIVVSTDVLSMKHIRDINLLLEDYHRCLNVPRIENYLNRKLGDSLSHENTVMTLPLNKGTSTSVHYAKAIMDGEKVNLTICASLLDSLTLNNRKYKLYHSGVGFLLTMFDNERNAEGYAENYQYTEFETLGYIHHKDFALEPEDARIALLKMLADHGISAELPIGNIRISDYEENRIITVRMKAKDGQFHAIQLSGSLLFEQNMNGVHYAVYGSHQHATLLICNDTLQWSSKGSIREMLDMIDHSGESSSNKEEIRTLKLALVKSLTKTGLIECLTV